MCECQDMSMDVKTPRNVYLSAFYKRSFAFYTVKSRLPIILTQLIDTLVRNKEQIAAIYGEIAHDDLKKVIGEISKLKYEIQTNKPLPYLTSTDPDIHFFNEHITKQASEEGHTTYFNTIWLLTECYMYRRIKQSFSFTESLKDYDYFGFSKRDSYESALALIVQLGNHMLEVEQQNNTDPEESFKSMLKLNLWGNKCDLSISLGKTDNPGNLFDTHLLDPCLLSDQSQDIWEVISKGTDTDIVDIVFDNAGYELFTDLCLADYIVRKNLAKKIRFYVKTIPWFISDAMEHDVYWTLDKLKQHSNESLQVLATRWYDYLTNGQWEIVSSSFWTLPYEFKFMKDFEPQLYKKLSEAKLIFFKGDLNYRKLFGEINWDPVTSVDEALQGFHPSKLCALRTIKADIVAGLKEGIAEELDKKDPKWMETGEYGLIQFSEKIVKIQ
ncbi:damage-control phosphatase ARMT1-like isoform X1 [Sitophilus oryzae]|uniref:Sugar phosphate phosphatase n=2 Tax=Sitophilus oryzae TaxID=7048 RepID=A0A6J2XNR0_SITOR|nr:damage-control phosphatase ARMT1-like isoform X1 [Sitophilus oryzae]